MATAAMEMVTVEQVYRGEKFGAWRHILSGCQIPSE
jgi:hypothetical protein